MRERELFPHGSLRASANRSRPLSASGVRLRPVPAVSPALVAFGDGPLGPRLRLFAQPVRRITRKSRGELSEGDLVAHVLELLDEAVLSAGGVSSTGEVVAAEVLVIALAAEEMPADDQDGVADRDRRFLLADATDQPPVLGGQVGVAGV